MPHTGNFSSLSITLNDAAEQQQDLVTVKRCGDGGYQCSMHSCQEEYLEFETLRPTEVAASLGLPPTGSEEHPPRHRMNMSVVIILGSKLLDDKFLMIKPSLSEKSHWRHQVVM